MKFAANQRSPSLVKWNMELNKLYPMRLLYRHTNLFIRATEWKRVSTLIKLASLKGNELAVDVGCEEGFLLERFPKNTHAVGVDIDPMIVGRAKRRLGRFEFVQADIQHLPFRRGLFDVIVCSEVLEHTPKPNAALIEMASLLCKEGGRMVLSVPNTTLIRLAKLILHLIRAERLLGGLQYGEAAGHLHNFSVEALKELLPASLTIRKIVAAPFRPLAIRIIALTVPSI